MTLKAVLESLDDISEELKSEYKEKDGKFYLDLDDTIKFHTSILPLSNAFATQKTTVANLRSENATLKAKTVGLPDDFDPATYQEIVAELEAMKIDPNRDKDVETKLQRSRDQYETRIRNLEEKYTTEIAAKDSEISKRDLSINRLVVDDGLTKALVNAGVGKEFLKAAGSMLRPSVKIEHDEETGAYKPIVETDLGAVPVDQFIENWSKSDEGKPFIKNPVGGGSGGSGGDTGRSEANPWSEKTFNLTEQGRILKSDRAKAERLMKAAGKSSSEMARILNP